MNARREHRSAYNSIGDPRVSRIVALTRALLADNAAHVAACKTVDADC